MPLNSLDELNGLELVFNLFNKYFKNLPNLNLQMKLILNSVTNFQFLLKRDTSVKNITYFLLSYSLILISKHPP